MPQNRVHDLNAGRKRAVKVLTCLVTFLIVAALMVAGIGGARLVANYRAQGGVAHVSPSVVSSEYAGTPISQFHSSVDKDGDGVDDQVDILEGARAYVATKPRYASKYYASGWPDDGQGVCTDVVAQALLSAGYDLKEEVAADIANHPGGYGIANPDANIDFRRVQTLKVFFAHTAIALTTDTSDVEQWQGGDIVIYDDHIAVVSDKRDGDGVPWIIHHYRVDQESYEEDALRNWGTINGHYRISE